MTGFIYLILLLPIIVYWGTCLFLEEGHKTRLYMETWVRSSVYHMGILAGCVLKCAVPPAEETKTALEGVKSTEAFTKGIKEIWK